MKDRAEYDVHQTAALDIQAWYIPKEMSVHR